jgi:hypothetical protein
MTGGIKTDDGAWQITPKQDQEINLEPKLSTVCDDDRVELTPARNTIESSEKDKEIKSQRCRSGPE